MSVEEALLQLRDNTLMIAAILAYQQAGNKDSCESCCLAIGDNIVKLMRPQR